MPRTAPETFVGEDPALPGGRGRRYQVGADMLFGQILPYPDSRRTETAAIRCRSQRNAARIG